VAAITAVLRLRIPAKREWATHYPIELPVLSMPKDGLAALRMIAEAVVGFMIWIWISSMVILGVERLDRGAST